MSVKVITNNVPRDIIHDYELTAEEREQFDYLDWSAIDEGSASASFFRYKGELHDLGEFSADFGITKGSGLPAYLSNWSVYRSDSAFSALVVRYVMIDHSECVIVGLVLS